MREILFRGKSTVGIDKWIEGTGVFNDGINTWISFNEPNRAIAYGIKHRIVLPETVGQYTGLTDKNGKKIFEGDIVKAYDESYGNGFAEVKGKVFFNCGSFDIDVEDVGYIPLYSYGTENIEVIGNIHDNSELLKGGEG